MIKSRVEPYLSSLKTGSWSRLLRQTRQRNPLPFLPSPSTTTLRLASAPQTSTKSHYSPGIADRHSPRPTDRPTVFCQELALIERSSFNCTAISIQHHPTETLSLPSLHPKVTPEVAHPFNTRLKSSPLTFNPTSTTQTADNSAPKKMPYQGVAPHNRKTDEQRWREVMDFMESVWKLWVAANECWIRLMVLISNNVETPRRVDGEGNGDGAEN
ncbi:hypothetical protein K435DRAFT_803612 [Dendrothele bispora CBS 962.96]|uniref:Uncharacterized protein n=1 Tax=Dendrothele bispora (strain CBS 962.96) TaxID=1314807 RepID=A0A4S8LGV5_DENBC|nr:hypothetical protein K435DRAFT_803612 [Dendrothele bispora CBS 962.96]